MAHSDELVQKALFDYRHSPDLSTKDIAAKYGVSSSTIVEWAEKAKLKRRPRGRRPYSEPTARHRAILDMAQTFTLGRVGLEFGMSKQATQRIVQRWKGWQRPKRPPFERGDVIRWNGKKYTVVSPGLYDGTVLDSKGQTILRFGWTMKGQTAVKVGVDKRALPPRD